jgi:hypothetical protein
MIHSSNQKEPPDDFPGPGGLTGTTYRICIQVCHHIPGGWVYFMAVRLI